ncbi:MAG TPA: ectonucleotide pyrophosphatase/phosphodiesterase [Pseudacidobacterium sp.]|jgi:alkaline phosphatase D|nr:ectonucleotide pyrophosphatase/phosphodiesterase [Pseudacidobacterium sp.]
MKRLLLLLFCALLSIAAGGQQIAPVITVDNGPNALIQEQKHYVVMVSLDGFRYDYAKKYNATHLLELAKHGSSAPGGMVPSYPSLTFPNHYTLVTGLYPEHHGIVAMSFYDQQRQERYAYNDPKTNSDGSWYGGTPLWVLAEQQGMRSACFFWPGSEAAIKDMRPSYYLHFDDKFPDDRRVDQVLAWLKLPEDKRPHFITLYYSNVDHAGHEFGPDSTQVADAVKRVDTLIGKLHAGLDALHMPIDLIIVSDHGMARREGSWINLDQYADLSRLTTVGSLLYAGSEADADSAYQKLKAADGTFFVYRRAKMPAWLHYDDNPRAGDPIIVAKGPYAIRAHGPAAGEQDHPPNMGVHGYDPRDVPEMKAIFYAVGPDIRSGVTLKPFENVNVYPFIAKILKLQAPPTDGSLNILSSALTDAALQ